MNISVLCALIAALFFLIACLDWPPVSGKAIAIGLFFLALAHCLTGVSFGKA